MSNPYIPFPESRPYTNITPFTVRDGATYLMVLESLREWLRDSLVPHVDGEIAELVASWNSSIATLMDQLLNDSVDLQDPVMATIANEPNSQFRAVLDDLFSDLETHLGTLFPAKADVYTKTEADAKFPLKTASYTKAEADTKFKTVTGSDQADTDLGVRIDGTVTRLVTLEGLAITTGGRLTQVELDKRYEQKFLNPVAIFIGSSNVEPFRNTWPQEFCTRNGLICKNFGVGGGGFLSGGAASFYSQAVAAANDSTINKAAVKYFFIADCSNDIRAQGNVAGPAQTTLSFIESNYPNARVIILPATMPYTAANWTPDVRRAVGRVYNQLRNTSIDFNRVEVIKNSALWLWDGGSWSAGETIDVHMNSNGQKRVRFFLEQYVFRGIDHANDIGDGTGAVSGNDGVIHSIRQNGLVHTYGNFTLATDQNTSVKLMQVYAGYTPIDNIPLTCIRKNDGLVKTLSFEYSGDVNLQIPVPAGFWYFNTTYLTV